MVFIDQDVLGSIPPSVTEVETAHECYRFVYYAHFLVLHVRQRRL